MKEYQDRVTLKQLYIGNKMSMREIADKYSVSEETVRYWMIKHGIERRGRSESIPMAKSKGTVPFSTSRSDGYNVWIHQYKNQRDTVFVHRLIAVAEYGVESLSEKVVHHNNGVKWDNRPNNLELMTDRDHKSHHHESGDIKTSQYHTVISEQDCEGIRKRHKNGETHLEISKDYSVTRPTITRHINGDCHHE